MPDCDDDLGDLKSAAPAYRRALWVVVILNLGYGLVEGAAGFLGASQALKADALDFLGDGLITLLAVVALGWRPHWRARAALLQGWFLAALGLGVLANTTYRIVVLKQPEPQVIWLFGGIALAVNVAAALVLMPYGKGDANMNAVWLFSRNDAIGNVIVVVAGLMVSWTGTPWPDLVAAALLAALFLKSAIAIVGRARAELSGPTASSPDEAPPDKC